MSKKDVQNQATKAEAQDPRVSELTEALQRERADAVNMRRQHEEQLAKASSSVKADVIERLLPIIDNLERALKHVPKDLENHDYVKGVAGVVKQAEKTFEDLGIRKIATVGQPFDPNVHEAVSAEEGEGDQEVVSEELQSGYQLGDGPDAIVLRHAMVRVKS